MSVRKVKPYNDGTGDAIGMPRVRARRYERPIHVMLPCQGNRLGDERNHKVLGIEEDIQGADVLTFECAFCGETHTSRRYG